MIISTKSKKFSPKKCSNVFRENNLYFNYMGLVLGSGLVSGSRFRFRFRFRFRLRFSIRFRFVFRISFIFRFRIRIRFRFMFSIRFKLRFDAGSDLGLNHTFSYIKPFLIFYLSPPPSVIPHKIVPSLILMNEQERNRS